MDGLPKTLTMASDHHPEQRIVFANFARLGMQNTPMCNVQQFFAGNKKKIDSSYKSGSSFVKFVW